MSKKYLDLTGLTTFWTQAQSYIRNNSYDDTELAAEVAANTAAIEVLNGTGDGSVSKIVTDEIAKLVAGADTNFDTLKEISDFIINDINGTAGLVNKVNANSGTIEELENIVSVLDTSGDGDSYLADDGTYKKISSSEHAIHAETADYATNAGAANTSNFANTAESDADGNVITDTYATKEEVSDLNVHAAIVNNDLEDVNEYITASEFDQTIARLEQTIRELREMIDQLVEAQ